MTAGAPRGVWTPEADRHGVTAASLDDVRETGAAPRGWRTALAEAEALVDRRAVDWRAIADELAAAVRSLDADRVKAALDRYAEASR